MSSKQIVHGSDAALPTGSAAIVGIKACTVAHPAPHGMVHS
jgi:hypothetical protein